MLKVLIIEICAVILLISGCTSNHEFNTVKFGICSDVHLPTMHDSEYRIQTFVDSMNTTKPDFIIELGDFGTPAPEYAHFFDIWNSFPGDKYHVIGNHEMDGGYSREEAVAYRQMKNSYYSFDKGGFHFIVLDANDKKDENTKGYKQYIGKQQQTWLQEDLNVTELPVVVFSHQGLTISPGAEETYGVENYQEIQQIFQEHNKQKPFAKVVACFNGHTHYDYAEKVEDIWYITINSMAYQWMGEAYTHIRYSEEVDKNFRWIKYTAPHKEPIWGVVEISSEGYIKIEGKSTEWVGPSPWDLNYPEELKKYVRPAVSDRLLEFSLN
jgi:predicted phosphodiesterase